MGALGSKVSFFSSDNADDQDLIKRDDRRRNSLAFYIARYNKFDGDDYTPLIEEIRLEQAPKKKALEKQQPKSKFTKAADAILAGNMRELRNQIILNFKAINRKYKDPHNDNSLVHFVCREGYFPMLKFLSSPENYTDDAVVVVDYAPKNNRNRTPLFVCFTPPTASFCGQMYGVNPDGSPKAERPEDIEVASDWIKPGGPKSRERCIELLLRNGVDPNERDFHDFTAMHYAAMWGWTSTARLLIEYKSEINCATITGRTPLMFAVEFLNGSFVETLLRHPDIHIDASDGDGFTALLIACEIGEDALAIAKVLLERGADPNCINHRRRSPLWYACSAQSLAFVNLLFDFKVQRDGQVLALLEGDVAESIRKRMADEEKAARAAADEMEKAENRRKLLQSQEGVVESEFGYANKSPWGAWIEYNDKRGGGSFYYNPVTRKSQREKPRDFKPKKNYVVKDATFGMSFYH